MSTKKKMIVSITSMCVVLLVAVVSVIAVWAATSASVKSNISITYTIQHVEGTMKMRYADRNSTSDSSVGWRSLKTENGSGGDTLTFGGDNPLEGSFGGGYWSSWEYMGIHPMLMIEVQLTNTSSTSYMANFTMNEPDPIDLIGTDKGQWPITDVYLVKDYFATGTTLTPQVTKYFEEPENYGKETVSSYPFTSTDFEVKNDGTYCFYLCILFDHIGHGYDTVSLTFSVDLHNAYAGD